MRDILIAAYLDYVNNYATAALYAEHNGLTTSEALALLNVARKVAEHDHPEQ